MWSIHLMMCYPGLHSKERGGVCVPRAWVRLQPRGKGKRHAFPQLPLDRAHSQEDVGFSLLCWGSEILIGQLRLLRHTQFSSVQSLSRVWLFATPWIAARQASLSITNTWSLLKPMSIESVMPSNLLILCRPLLLLPPIPLSIRVFSSESTLRMRWPKYWSFSFSISPSNDHPGLISFRMDWLDLLTVQGTLKSVLQHHSSKASFFRCSALLRV